MFAKGLRDQGINLGKYDHRNLNKNVNTRATEFGILFRRATAMNSTFDLDALINPLKAVVASGKAPVVNPQSSTGSSSSTGAASGSVLSQASTQQANYAANFPTLQGTALPPTTSTTQQTQKE